MFEQFFEQTIALCAQKCTFAIFCSDLEQARLALENQEKIVSSSVTIKKVGNFHEDPFGNQIIFITDGQKFQANVEYPVPNLELLKIMKKMGFRRKISMLANEVDVNLQIFDKSKPAKELIKGEPLSNILALYRISVFERD
jgi:hypothetical protein